MKYVWATASHVGRVRDNNEDTVFPESDGSTEQGVLIAVADGMGGAVGGEIASSTAIGAATTKPGSPLERTRNANNAVLAKAATTPSLTGMGTTLTLAQITDQGELNIAHVGDSRAYLLRKGELSQITSDHTLVAEWVAAGAITAEEARVHPRRAMLMRTLGVGLEVAIDTHEISLEPGDRLLLCSDGLTVATEDAEIASILSEGTAASTVWQLIETANDNGGSDNISVVVLDAI